MCNLHIECGLIVDVRSELSTVGYESGKAVVLH